MAKKEVIVICGDKMVLTKAKRAWAGDPDLCLTAYPEEFVELLRLIA